MNRLTVDFAEILNNIDIGSTVIAVLGAVGVWTLGVIAVLLIIRGSK